MAERTNVPRLPCFLMAEHNQSTSLPDNVLVLKDGKCWVWGWRCCWEKVSGLQSLRCTQLNAENFCWMHTSLAECTPLQPNASHFSWMHTDYVQCILKIFVVWFHNCSHKACFFKTSERHILKSSVQLNCTVHSSYTTVLSLRICIIVQWIQRTFLHPIYASANHFTILHWRTIEWILLLAEYNPRQESGFVLLLVLPVRRGVQVMWRPKCFRCNFRENVKATNLCTASPPQ